MQKVSAALKRQKRPLRLRNIQVRTHRNPAGFHLVVALFFLCMISSKFNATLFFRRLSDTQEQTDTTMLYQEQAQPTTHRNASSLPLSATENSSQLMNINSSLTVELRNSTLSEPRKGESLLELNKSTAQVLPTMSALQLICYQQRDRGLIDVLRASALTFCGNGSVDDDSKTKVTLFNAPGNFRATLFSSLAMDFRHAKVSRSIANLAQDGGDHDPRFELNPDLIQCSCPELATYGSARVRAITEGNHPHRTTYEPDPLRLWHPALDKVPDRRDDLSTLCLRTRTQLRHSQTNDAVPDSSALEIDNRVILIARKDDHNPFFQVSSAFNAWILMQTLDWDPRTTQVVQMDVGFPTPMDSLHHELLAPNRPMIFGKELKGKHVLFKSQVLLPPFESDGPMMQDLNNNCKCFDSSLFQEFRRASLQALNASANASIANDGSVLVTVISRRPYSGRTVQRMWLNEYEVLQKLREVYANKRIRFQSIDFVALDLRQQMQIMLDSDVVIGMHGAGLVNVLWTQPNTLVMEIFPRQKRRWGYRNICQNIGCKYHEFRGGRDISTGRNDPNANDKIIPSQHFLAFFEPLLETHLQAQGRELLDAISSSA